MAARPQRERRHATISNLTDLKNVNGKRPAAVDGAPGPVIGGSQSARAAVATVFSNATNKRAKVANNDRAKDKDGFAVPAGKEEIYIESDGDVPAKPVAKDGSKGKSKAKTVDPPLAATASEKSKPGKTAAEKDASRVKQQKEDAKRKKEQIKQETAQWRLKYRTAIKSFVFFFDRVDPVVEAQLAKEVEKWGAQVDSFFSKAVTHVITSRPVPSPPTPGSITKAVPSPIAVRRVSPYKLPQSPARENALNGVVGPMRRGGLPNKARISPRVEALDKSYVLEQGHVADTLLQKALDFHMKVWKIEKLQNVLSRLVDDRPVKPLFAPKPSLPSLLRDEARQGHTLERDLTVPRADYYYFPSKMVFFLVEDSTGDHRPIHVREFENTSDYSEAKWPIIRKGMEGKTAMPKCQPNDSYRTVQDRIERMFETRAREEEEARRKAPATKLFELDGPDSDDEQENEPPAGATHIFEAKTQAEAAGNSKSLLPAAPIGNHLRRSASMNILQQRQSRKMPRAKSPAEDEELVNATAQEHHRGPGDVFLAASGNSVNITSNIASGTSTTRSGAIGPSSHPKHFLQDRRMAEFNRKGYQMGGASGAISISNPPRPSSRLSTNAGRAVNPRLRAIQDQSSRPLMKRSQSLDGALMSQKKRQQSVKKGVSIRTKLSQALQCFDVQELAAKEEAKPGYCENCRIKYDDFKEHVRTRKHRKFAKNDDNWWQLDELMQRTTRVVKAGVVLPDRLKPKQTASLQLHLKGENCGACEQCVGEPAEEDENDDDGGVEGDEEEEEDEDE